MKLNNNIFMRICYFSIVFVLTLLSIHTIFSENNYITKDQSLSRHQLNRCYPSSHKNNDNYKKSFAGLVPSSSVVWKQPQQQNNQDDNNNNNNNNSNIIILPREYEIADFLEGPGLDKVDQTTVGAVACKFVTNDYSEHYPHIMQQLYRCFSWFYWNQNQKNNDKHLYLISSPKHKNYFVRGFIDTLHEVFHINIVKYRNKVPVVRPIINYSYNASAPNIGYQMTNPNEVKYLRNSILEYYSYKINSIYQKERIQQKILPPNHKNYILKAGSCLMSDKNKNNNNNNNNELYPPRITILNRKEGGSVGSSSTGRHLFQSNEIKDAILQMASYNNNTLQNVQHIRIIDHFDDASFYEQISMFASTDILISPHGAQLSGIPFMSDCGSIIELFPFGYYNPEFYASLAAISGLSYTSLYTGRNIQYETTTYMKDLLSRSVARSFDICPNIQEIVDAVLEQINLWYQCCYNNNHNHIVQQPIQIINYATTT